MQQTGQKANFDPALPRAVLCLARILQLMTARPPPQLDRSCCGRSRRVEPAPPPDVRQASQNLA
jgi:hypothetical protein